MNLKDLYRRMCVSIMIVIGAHLSKRMKRSVLLTSLSARLKESNTFDNETYAKLNRVLALGKRTEALEASVFLSKAIWHGQDTREILGSAVPVETLSQSPDTDIIANIVNAVPSWLRYGDDNEISEDVVRLLKAQDVVFSS